MSMEREYGATYTVFMHMFTDMCIGMGVDMHMDMCMDMRTVASSFRNRCLHRRGAIVAAVCADRHGHVCRHAHSYACSYV